MTVYLLRHAIAEDRSASGRDRDRVLTGEGIAKLETVMRVAAKAGVKPERILASPYQRTVQTAAVAKQLLGVAEDIMYSDAFTPEALPRAAWDEIRNWRDEEPLLVVTHEPLVSGLFSLLLGVSEYVHDFKKAGLAKLEISRATAQPAGTVRWILTPALAAAVASEAGD
jgi:phosphohistidine phosphatase